MLKLLIGKNATRKLNFFRILEESPSLSERGKLMMDKLDISEYLLEKIVQELNADFREFGMVDIFKVHIVGDEIVLEESGVATSDYLEEQYLRDSYIFGIIEAIFLGTFTSVSEYALEKYISYPIVYRELKRLRKELAKRDIIISKKFHFTGKELEVRNLLTMLFTKTYKRDYQIYGLWEETADNTVKELEKEYSTLFSEKTKMTLRHYLCVSKIRLMHEQSNLREEISTEQQTFFFEETNDLETDSFMGEMLVEKDWQAERVILYSILLSEGHALTGVQEKINKDPKISELSENFTTTLLDKFDLTARQFEINGLRQELDRLHYQLCYYPYGTMEEGRKIDVSFFEEAYGDFFTFVRQYIVFSKKDERRSVLWYSSVFVFYRYLLMLITYIPPNLYSKPIYLYIDFSLGKLYNNYIEKSMSFLTSLNLIVEEQLSENTQLILTDMYFENKNKSIDTIVWLEPPRAHDWAIFASKISEIKNEMSH